MFCPTCGNQNSDDAKVCGYCGTPIPGDEAFVLPVEKMAQPTEPTAPVINETVNLNSEPFGSAPNSNCAPFDAAPQYGAAGMPQKYVYPSSPVPQPKNSNKGLIITIAVLGGVLLLSCVLLILIALGVFEDKEPEAGENVKSSVLSENDFGWKDESGYNTSIPGDYIEGEESAYSSDSADDYYEDYYNDFSGSKSSSSEETLSSAEDSYDFQSEIIGIWKYDFNISEVVGIDASVEMTFIFNNDNTYSLSVDDLALKEYCMEVLEQTAGSIGMTGEDILKSAGMTIEEYLDMVKEEAGGELGASGNYKIDGNKLYMNNDGSDEFSEEDALEMFMQGKDIVLTDGETEITLVRSY